MGFQDLDIDLLRCFVAVAEAKGFTAAGKIVGRTQSAISVKIQRLEHLLWELSNYRIGFGARFAFLLRL